MSGRSLRGLLATLLLYGYVITAPWGLWEATGEAMGLRGEVSAAQGRVEGLEGRWALWMKEGTLEDLRGRHGELRLMVSSTAGGYGGAGAEAVVGVKVGVRGGVGE